MFYAAASCLHRLLLSLPSSSVAMSKFLKKAKNKFSDLLPKPQQGSGVRPLSGSSIRDSGSAPTVSSIVSRPSSEAFGESTDLTKSESTASTTPGISWLVLSLHRIAQSISSGSVGTVGQLTGESHSRHFFYCCRHHKAQ